MRIRLALTLDIRRERPEGDEPVRPDTHADTERATDEVPSMRPLGFTPFYDDSLSGMTKV